MLSNNLLWQSQHVWQSLSYLNNFSFEFFKRYTVQLYLAQESFGIFTLMKWSIRLHLNTRSSFVLWKQLCVELEERNNYSQRVLSFIKLFQHKFVVVSDLFLKFVQLIPNEQSRKLVAIQRQCGIFHLLHNKHSLILHFKKLIIYVYMWRASWDTVSKLKISSQWDAEFFWFDLMVGWLYFPW